VRDGRLRHATGGRKGQNFAKDIIAKQSANPVSLPQRSSCRGRKKAKTEISTKAALVGVNVAVRPNSDSELPSEHVKRFKSHSSERRCRFSTDI
jgi:hypothetical protein